MAVLNIFRKDGRESKLIMRQELDSSRAYIVGRGEGCDILLPDERGVSREHFRLEVAGEHWHLTVLSRYGELYFEGQKVPELNLKEQVEFDIPPLHFQFSESVANNQPEFMANSMVKSSSFQEQYSPVFSLAPEEERTLVGALPQAAFLKLTNDNKDVLQVYRLDGEAWVAGRDTTCAIFVDHEKMSRKHFEIRRQEHIYFLRDLGSSNGTTLNYRSISGDEWQQLASGDVIRAGDLSLRFELRDAQFQERLLQAQEMINSPAVYLNPEVQEEAFAVDYQPDDFSAHQGAGTSGQFDSGVGVLTPIKGQGLFQKKNRVRIAIGAVVVVAALFSVLDDGSSPKKDRDVGQSKTDKKAGDFLRLKPEQQEFVRQTHKLAKDLLMQGRYEMARQEILKLHQFVAVYEDSAEVENTAVQGIQLLQEKARAEAREREKVEIEEKIARQLQACRAKIHSKIESEEIDNCLAPVIQFNPEHPGIQALKSQVDQIIADRNIRNAQKADYAERVARQKMLFNKAAELGKSGQFLQAVKAYEVVANSQLPDPQNFKAKAQREIASIQQNLSEKQVEFERQADASYKKNDFKEAITLLKKAVAINPENEVMKSKVNMIMNELKKQMQTLYQEGILEESVGEVESAKTKWKKILSLSLPDEEYHKKATIKLKKYGAL